MHNTLLPLQANATYLANLSDSNRIGMYIPEDDDDGVFSHLPPEFTTVGAMGTKPASIDETLHGPNAKEWQAALDYEINQLEKLGTGELKTYLPDRLPSRILSY